MAADGVISPSPSTALEEKPKSRPRAATTEVADGLSFMAISHHGQLQVSSDQDESSQNRDQGSEDAQLSRRTSIPSRFGYGASMSLADRMVEERRWRSFDCNGAGAKKQRMDAIANRIQQERQTIERESRLLGRKRSRLLRSVQGLFSSHKKELIGLRQMQLIADVTKHNRSLTVLQNVQREVVLSGNEESDTEDESRPSDVMGRVVQHVTDVEQALADDCVHYILEIQCRWLQKLMEMNADKTLVPSQHGKSVNTILTGFLNEFITSNTSRFLRQVSMKDRLEEPFVRVPCAFDAPTTALAKFEVLVVRHRLIHHSMRRALDDVCHQALGCCASFNKAETSTLSVFQQDGRAPKYVVKSLVNEVTDEIVVNARLFAHGKHAAVVRAFVEQMVYSRIGCVCYVRVADELEDKNASWRQLQRAFGRVRLTDVGLSTDLLTTVEGQDDHVFPRTIDKLNNLPHLVPSCVLAAFLSGIRTLYAEATETLRVGPEGVSADVLLPLLVFVLCRCDLSQLHTQIYTMRLALDDSEEGSEAAYYIACLQAAMGYITEYGRDRRLLLE